MADITLSDGREITFDFKKLTLKEYRALLDPKQNVADEDAIVARVCGLSIDEYTSLNYEEWKQVLRAFFLRSREPADPN